VRVRATPPGARLRAARSPRWCCSLPRCAGLAAAPRWPEVVPARAMPPWGHCRRP